MKRNFLLMLFAASSILLLNSCDKEIAEEDNDGEVLTTLELHFTERGTQNSLIYKFDDPDGFGTGSVPPVIDLIRLLPNKVYDVELRLLNKTANPIEDVTAEVEEESADHRFYYLPATGGNITVDNLDKDADGLPLGINSTWTTGAKAAGTIRIVLRHYPNGGKATDDLVDSPKSGTDIDTEFATAVD